MLKKTSYTGIARPYDLGEFSVDQAAKKMVRFAYFHKRLMFIAAGQMPALEDWDLKQGVGRHLYEDAEAVNELRTRALQLRLPNTLLDKTPDPFMELFFDELLHAANDLEYVCAIYEYVKPTLLQVYRDYCEKTQQIVDIPTIRHLHQIITDLEEQIAWGKNMVEEIKSRSWYQDAAVISAKDLFISNLRSIEQLGGRLSGQEPKSQTIPRRYRSMKPYVLPEKSRRNREMGDTVLYRTGMGLRTEDENLHLFVEMMRIRQEEMTAAEMLAGVIYSQKEMEWEFYYDLARHLWDEIRHSMFGQAALEKEGYDWRNRPQYTSAYDLLVPELASTRYAFLSIAIEDAGMKRPGKVGEFEFCRDTMKHPLMTQFQDYDWADEVNHARFGRKWTPQLLDENLETIREMMNDFKTQYLEKTGPIPIQKITSKS